MTRKQWAQLSADKRRMLIAELCGWTHVEDVDGEYIAGIPPKKLRWMSKESQLGCGMVIIPDYISDLNAMHEAENIVIAKSKAVDFWTELYLICHRDGNPSWHSTAAQRAEAFALIMEPE